MTLGTTHTGTGIGVGIAGVFIQPDGVEHRACGDGTALGGVMVGGMAGAGAITGVGTTAIGMATTMAIGTATIMATGMAITMVGIMALTAGVAEVTMAPVIEINLFRITTEVSQILR